MKLKYINKMITAFLLSSTFTFAQEIKPLNVGDKVPDIFLKKMLNHKSNSGKLSDFKGKAIIIDQWFIACAPCVGSMRHLDSIQEKFGKDLIVLPVTFEKQQSVEKFWSQNIIVKGLKFTQVVEDTVIRKHFPAVNFPHQVWIDKNQIVVAITDGSNTTEAAIKRFLNGEKLKIDQKVDEMDANIRYATEPDIFIRYEENKHKLLFYSYFSTFRNELSGMGRSTLDTVSRKVRITVNNFPICDLYNFAYTNNSWDSYHRPTRFIRLDSNKNKSFTDSRADSIYQFCYDLIYRDSTLGNFGKIMISDLDRFFNLRSSEKMKNIDCYIISPNGNGSKYQNKLLSERERFHTISFNQAKRVISNDQFTWMLSRIINDSSPNLIIFELGKSKRINFDIAWNLQDLELMNQDLAKYDLKIEKGVRERKVIVLENAHYR